MTDLPIYNVQKWYKAAYHILLRDELSREIFCSGKIKDGK